MKNFIAKIIAWFCRSNRYKHFIGGFIIGVVATATNDALCGVECGVVAGASLEFKDHQWGGKADIIDFLCTSAGSALGSGLTYILKSL
jgi:hypothetical protein